MGSDDQYRTGPWSVTESANFENAIKKYGTDWEKIALAVPTRRKAHLRGRLQQLESNNVPWIPHPLFGATGDVDKQRKVPSPNKKHPPSVSEGQMSPTRQAPSMFSLQKSKAEIIRAVKSRRKNSAAKGLTKQKKEVDYRQHRQHHHHHHHHHNHPRRHHPHHQPSQSSQLNYAAATASATQKSQPIAVRCLSVNRNNMKSKTVGRGHYMNHPRIIQLQTVLRQAPCPGADALVANYILSDRKILVGTMTYFVHSTIVGKNSSFFQQIFAEYDKHKYLKNGQDLVVLLPPYPSAFKATLTFLYTLQVPVTKLDYIALWHNCEYLKVPSRVSTHLKQAATQFYCEYAITIAPRTIMSDAFREAMYHLRRAHPADIPTLLLSYSSNKTRCRGYMLGFHEAACSFAHLSEFLRNNWRGLWPALHAIISWSKFNPEPAERRDAVEFVCSYLVYRLYLLLLFILITN